MANSDDQFVTGDGRCITTADIAGFFKDIVSHSSIGSGRIQQIDQCDFSITCGFTNIDCDTLTGIKTKKIYALETTVQNQIKSVKCVSPPLETIELARCVSNNGLYLANLKRSTKDSNNQQLEIWEEGRLLKTISISELQTHGEINTDEQFGSFQWCPVGKQDKLLYVCQSKKPKHTSYWKKESNNSDMSASSESKRGTEHLKAYHWGETLQGIEHTMVAVLDVSKDFEITVIDVKDQSLSQAQWFDNGRKIVSLAFAEQPRRLGVVYCNNRPSKITIHNYVDGEQSLSEELSIKNESISCFRVDNSLQSFVYLSCPLFGPHFHASYLNRYSLISEKNGQKLKDENTGKNQFFISNLAKRCFSAGDEAIIVVVTGPITSKLCAYNFDKRQLVGLDSPMPGISVLDFNHNLILAASSQIDVAPSVFISTFNPEDPASLVWKQVDERRCFQEVESTLYKIPVTDGTSFIIAILCEPNPDVLREKFSNPQLKNKYNSTGSLPTYIFPHGGPHSAFQESFYQSAIFFARLGIKTLLINYRGSIGVDEEYNRSLCGNVGQMDVEDCLQAIRHLVKEGKIDPRKLILGGGSHSGFLACHLSCQDEFKFTCAVIRNPVTDLVGSLQISDIPDWALSEGLAFENYDASYVPTTEEITKLYLRSPMSKAHLAKVPTLMLLGSEDLRVPMFQGERWVDNLRARGVEVSCKIYPDNHSLSKPEVLSDHTVTSGIWMLQHLSN